MEHRGSSPNAVAERLAVAETAPMPSLGSTGSLDETLRAIAIAPEPPAPIRRTVVLRLQRLADVARCFNGRSTVFVLLPDPPDEGAEVECVLVHPENGSEVKVPAYVTRVGRTLAGDGAELRFITPDDALRRRLLAFVRAS